MRNKVIVLLLFLVFSLLAILFFTSKNTSIDFNTQVKPILNKRCISCHGGVKQNSGFSLITRDLALGVNDSGKAAIVPGSPSQSEMIQRILTDDPEDRMPFEEPPLPKGEIKILKQWIKEGAKWGRHWAYIPVQKIKPPSTQKALGAFGEKDETKWGYNEIDQFILEKIKQAGLSPSIEANKAALLRRLSLDLIGLPAPDRLAQQFLNKENPISYEQVVDSLLASPHFGERWASMWLDLARYADSKGFERDFSRSIWEYRDYLIRAFNQDLPYDQFLIEQLAGDLLPNPTDAQYTATGFHRNTTTNDEGGTDNEEYRVAAVIDRVNTTWEAFMGTTFACVQCHGHPYDPFFHEDYYSFMAFFNNTRDADTHMDYPWLRKLSTVQKEKLQNLTKWVTKEVSDERAEEIRLFLKTLQPSIYSIETDSFSNAVLYDTKYLGFRKNGSARLSNVSLTNKNRLIFKALTAVPGGTFYIHLDSLNGQQIASHRLPHTRWNYQFFEIPLKETTGKHNLFLRYDNPSFEDPEAMGFQIDWFHFTANFPGEGKPGYQARKQDFQDLLEADVPHTLITVENPAERQRKTHVFDRGNWLVPTKEVVAKVPGIFESLAEKMPKNRLGLAQWMTSKNNPLTARTMVNRLWEQLFGTGLAETLEDLGTQGIPPTHPELLDWLAWRFMHDYEWSVKELLRLMVTSATYKQTSKVDLALLEADPYNKWYARGPRVRLSAEQIRDQALVVSGLFNPEMFGPPLMPFQPEDLWQTPYNDEAWTVSSGNSAYRRAIYTFVKRSQPYPSMETFDVAPRQVCVSRRIRTNTPLQALVTLNDPVFVETAKHLAVRMQKEGGTTITGQIQKGYQLALGQDIRPEKQKVFEQLYQKSLQDFEQHPNLTAEMLGETKADENATQIAALVVVANAIMNLDEFLTK